MPRSADRVVDFVDRKLGKRVVPTKDTPGFIANRIGTYWLAVAVNAAMDQGLTIEEADQIGGRPMGVPKTGIFGLIDLVGIDLMPLLTESLTANLPKGDPYFDTVRDQPLIERMIAEGRTGRKAGAGFYSLDKKTRHQARHRLRNRRISRSGEAPAPPPARRGRPARADQRAGQGRSLCVGDPGQGAGLFRLTRAARPQTTSPPSMTR